MNVLSICFYFSVCSFFYLKAVGDPNVVEKILPRCNMNVLSICFYFSVCSFLYLKAVGVPNINEQDQLVTILGLMAILNKEERDKK